MRKKRQPPLVLSFRDSLGRTFQRDKRLNDGDAGAQSLEPWIKLTANSSMEETAVISSLSSTALSPYLSPPIFNLLTELAPEKLLKQRGYFHKFQRLKQPGDDSVSCSHSVHLFTDRCAAGGVIVLQSNIQAAWKNALAVLCVFCSESARGHLFAQISVARRLDWVSRCQSGWAKDKT